MSDFVMTFDGGEEMNMGFDETQTEVPTNHNDLVGRDANNAHPISAISQLAETLQSHLDAIALKVNQTYVDGEIARVEAEIPSLDGYATESYVDEAVAEVQGDVDDIEAKIPTQATSTNKLADKGFVNSSISTNTATFRGTYTSVDDFPSTGDNNDYVFLKVMSTEEPTQVERYDRYKWNGSAFAFEYSLNNSSFTAAQWAAINSGMTSGDAALIRTALQPVPGKDLSTNDYTDADKQKLAGVEAEAEKNIAYATEPYAGVDLTQKFADEIANFADEWAWIKDRKTRGDFHGLHTHDYIPVTCTNGYILKPEIAGINTYKGAGDTEIGNHIDFITKDCWPDTIQYNNVNYNNGVGCDKFTGDGDTLEFQLTHRTASTFPAISSVTVGGTAVATENYSYDVTTGVLTFNEAPASGAVIKAVWTDPIKVPFLAAKVYAFINSEKMGVPNEAAADPNLVEVDYTSGGVWSKLPDKLKNVITTKRFNAGSRFTLGSLRTSNDSYAWVNLGKLWLPDEMEVTGNDIWCTHGYDKWFGRQYPCFMNGNRMKGSGNGGSRCHWWILPPNSGRSSSFAYVYSNGYAGNNSASHSSRVPVCFRI